MSARDVTGAIPAIRGRVQAGAPLAPFTWFRVGGPAEWLVRPADEQDLVALLAGLPAGMPLTLLGAASNLIVRDGGLRGVVLRLGGAFGQVQVEADGLVAGAAALDVTVAQHAAAAGLAGLEFLSGIPGSIGGAVAMNAGAYGAEVKHVLDWAEVATAEGIRRLPAADFAFAYRHATLPPRAVVTRARFHARPGDAAAIAARMEEIRAAREATQPVRARTGGSTFKNPPGAKAWALIDAAGCRGLTLGAAQVSEKHCNFLLNTGGATAAELEALGEQVRTRVLAQSGVTLEWEIKRIGEAGSAAPVPDSGPAGPSAIGAEA
ncbi:UDP-N-acetylmuramate dehydrogenase [Paracraurococcus lichenis]|uniref:UDP-N-acetylenolpyruvoylglucosamine reductase n=1 Tax=Paracraurococcus lichenis TaxID=3064888 RepID=A0ABT9E532_9PROT|nr:UDP-N-acetylmuramate dehydrogenase [Paracraurococcus sp. LOR1-02]MDO9711254.1 UDP-N-acetylmuramate dehydrogenase [Paracraurococcus sp. LOR1-02]